MTATRLICISTLIAASCIIPGIILYWISSISSSLHAVELLPVFSFQTTTEQSRSIVGLIGCYGHFPADKLGLNTSAQVIYHECTCANVNNFRRFRMAINIVNTVLLLMNCRQSEATYRKPTSSRRISTTARRPTSVVRPCRLPLSGY